MCCRDKEAHTINMTMWEWRREALTGFSDPAPVAARYWCIPPLAYGGINGVGALLVRVRGLASQKGMRARI